MASVTATINVNVNASNAMGQLAALSGMQDKVAAASLRNAKGSNVLTSAYARNARAIGRGLDANGRFVTSMAPIHTQTGLMAKQFDKGAGSMKDYFKNVRNGEAVNRLAAQRVMALQTSYAALGKEVNGTQKAMAIRPTGMMKEFGAQAMFAHQRSVLMRRSLDMGATSMVNWGKNTQWAGRQMVVGLGIPMAIAGAAAVKWYKDIESASISFKRVYGDTSTSVAEKSEMLGKIHKGVAEDMTKYGIAVADTLDVSAKAAATGARGEDLVAATTQTMRLATLGQMEYDQALEATIATQSIFKTSAQELPKSIDFLNAAENQTILSMEDMAVAIPRAGAAMKVAGGDVTDLAVLMGALRVGGINASMGANALKTGISKILKPTSTASEYVKDFGINLDKIGKNNKGDVIGMFKDLQGQVKELPKQDQIKALSSIFGLHQYPKIAAMMANLNDKQVKELGRLSKASSQELAQMSEDELSQIADSPMTKMQAAIEKFKNAMAPLGEAILTGLTPIVEFGAKIADFFAGNDIARNVLLIGGAFAGLAAVGTMITGVFANFFGNMIKGGLMLNNVFRKMTGKASLSYLGTEQLAASTAAKALGGAAQGAATGLYAEAAAATELTAALSRLAVASQSAVAGSRAVAGRGAGLGALATPRGGSSVRQSAPPVVMPASPVVATQKPAGGQAYRSQISGWFGSSENKASWNAAAKEAGLASRSQKFLSGLAAGGGSVYSATMLAHPKTINAENTPIADIGKDTFAKAKGIGAGAYAPILRHFDPKVVDTKVIEAAQAAAVKHPAILQGLVEEAKTAGAKTTGQFKLSEKYAEAQMQSFRSELGKTFSPGAPIFKNLDAMDRIVGQVNPEIAGSSSGRTDAGNRDIRQQLGLSGSGSATREAMAARLLGVDETVAKSVLHGTEQAHTSYGQGVKLNEQQAKAQALLRQRAGVPANWTEANSGLAVPASQEQARRTVNAQKEARRAATQAEVVRRQQQAQVNADRRAAVEAKRAARLSGQTRGYAGSGVAPAKPKMQSGYGAVAHSDRAKASVPALKAVPTKAGTGFMGRLTGLERGNIGNKMMGLGMAAQMVTLGLQGAGKELPGFVHALPMAAMTLGMMPEIMTTPVKKFKEAAEGAGPKLDAFGKIFPVIGRVLAPLAATPALAIGGAVAGLVITSKVVADKMKEEAFNTGKIIGEFQAGMMDSNDAIAEAYGKESLFTKNYDEYRARLAGTNSKTLKQAEEIANSDLGTKMREDFDKTVEMRGYDSAVSGVANMMANQMLQDVITPDQAKGLGSALFGQVTGAAVQNQLAQIVGKNGKLTGTDPFLVANRLLKGNMGQESESTAQIRQQAEQQSEGMPGWGEDPSGHALEMLDENYSAAQAVVDNYKKSAGYAGESSAIWGATLQQAFQSRYAAEARLKMMKDERDKAEKDKEGMQKGTEEWDQQTAAIEKMDGQIAKAQRSKQEFGKLSAEAYRQAQENFNRAANPDGTGGSEAQENMVNASMDRLQRQYEEAGRGLTFDAARATVDEMTDWGQKYATLIDLQSGLDADALLAMRARTDTADELGNTLDNMHKAEYTPQKIEKFASRVAGMNEQSGRAFVGAAGDVKPNQVKNVDSLAKAYSNLSASTQNIISKGPQGAKNLEAITAAATDPQATAAMNKRVKAFEELPKALKSANSFANESFTTKDMKEATANWKDLGKKEKKEIEVEVNTAGAEGKIDSIVDKIKGFKAETSGGGKGSSVEFISPESVAQAEQIEQQLNGMSNKEFQVEINPKTKKLEVSELTPDGPVPVTPKALRRLLAQDVKPDGPVEVDVKAKAVAQNKDFFGRGGFGGILGAGKGAGGQEIKIKATPGNKLDVQQFVKGDKTVKLSAKPQGKVNAQSFVRGKKTVDLSGKARGKVNAQSFVRGKKTVDLSGKARGKVNAQSFVSGKRTVSLSAKPAGKISGDQFVGDNSVKLVADPIPQASYGGGPVQVDTEPTPLPTPSYGGGVVGNIPTLGAGLPTPTYAGGTVSNIPTSPAAITSTPAYHGGTVSIPGRIVVQESTGGLFPGFASGGWKKTGGGRVDGPGGPTDDKINSRLSNGEWVMRAKAVDKYGYGFMKRINDMTIGRDEVLGFKKGGATDKKKDKKDDDKKLPPAQQAMKDAQKAKSIAKKKKQIGQKFGFGATARALFEAIDASDKPNKVANKILNNKKYRKKLAGKAGKAAAIEEGLSFQDELQVSKKFSRQQRQVWKGGIGWNKNLKKKKRGKESLADKSASEIGIVKDLSEEELAQFMKMNSKKQQQFLNIRKRLAKRELTNEQAFADKLLAGRESLYEGATADNYQIYQDLSDEEVAALQSMGEREKRLYLDTKQAQSQRKIALEKKIAAQELAASENAGLKYAAQSQLLAAVSNEQSYKLNKSLTQEELDAMEGMNGQQRQSFLNVRKWKLAMEEAAEKRFAAIELMDNTRLGNERLGKRMFIAKAATDADYKMMKDLSDEEIDAMASMYPAEQQRFLAMKRAAYETQKRLEAEDFLRSTKETSKLLASKLNVAKWFSGSNREALLGLSEEEIDLYNRLDSNGKAALLANKKLQITQNKALEILADPVSGFRDAAAKFTEKAIFSAFGKTRAQIDAANDMASYAADQLDRKSELEQREIDDINEAYDDQAKALQKIESHQNQIAQIEKGRLSVAQAISTGDVAAAARAVQEARQQEASIAREQMRNAIEEQKDKIIEERQDKIDAYKDQVEAIRDAIWDMQNQVSYIEKAGAKYYADIAAGIEGQYILKDAADITAALAMAGYSLGSPTYNLPSGAAASAVSGVTGINNAARNITFNIDGSSNPQAVATAVMKQIEYYDNQRVRAMI